MGKAVREFKDATSNIQRELNVDDIDEPKKEIPEKKEPPKSAESTGQKDSAEK
jgi:Sec-independent protein translocase protein TatA